MKKLLLSVAFVCVASISTNAQTTISQTGGVGPAANQGTAACQNQQQQNMRDNSYFRAYTMSATTKIVSVKIGVLSVNGSIPITVNLYKRTSAFPGSHPSGSTQVGTATTTLTSANNLSLVNVTFSLPIAVASGDIIVAEVKNADTPAANNYSLGCITGAETAPAYISSVGCQLATPQTIASLNVAGANPKIIIDLVEDASASSEQFFAENFTLYPNPTTDVLNISSKNGLNASEIRITDMTGKVVKVQKDASTVNVSNLASGTYLIDITTKEGKATSKFIKK